MLAQTAWRQQGMRTFLMNVASSFGFWWRQLCPVVRSHKAFLYIKKEVKVEVIPPFSDANRSLWATSAWVQLCFYFDPVNQDKLCAKLTTLYMSAGINASSSFIKRSRGGRCRYSCYLASSGFLIIRHMTFYKCNVHC